MSRRSNNCDHFYRSILFRIKRFRVDEMLQPNTSKFAVIFVNNNEDRLAKCTKFKADCSYQLANK